MTTIDTETLPGNAQVHDAPDAALREHLSDFATNAAKAALGHAYARPEAASFIDRSPGEIAVIRAMRWSGAGT